MLSRRKFLKLCLQSTAGLSLAGLLRPSILQALAEEEISRPPVIWLELGSCTGESISLDNSFDPNLKRLLLEMIELRYHWLFTQVHGNMVAKIIQRTLEEDGGKYILIIEGAVITRDKGMYNYVLDREGEMVSGIALLKELAAKAKHVVAVGACASFGGPASAYPNPAKAVGVQDVLDRKVINVPGCPSHPDWMIGTLAHLIMYGEPELNNYNCPTMFFAKTIHDLCSRRSDYENGKFAQYPGQEGCYYKIGCKGPVTYADCPIRQWNNHINWPVKAGIPCIGCASPHFPDGMMPYFQHLPDLHLPGGKARVEKIGAVLGGVTAIGITTHLVGSVVTGRMGKHLIKGTQLQEPNLGEIFSPQETMIQNPGQLQNKEESEFIRERLLDKLEEIIQQQRGLTKEIAQLKLTKKPSPFKKLKMLLKKRNEG